MARLTPSQFQSKIGQLQSQQRQAINRYNTAVRQYNQKLKQAVSNTNRAIDSRNREVRAHNARVRTNRSRIASAIARLRHQSTTVHFAYRASSIELHDAYSRLERQTSYAPSDQVDQLFSLSERENANNLETTEALLGGSDLARLEASENELNETTITDELSRFSEDLHSRWLGALYSLSPHNPDAARHFCTSAREVFVRILDFAAPDGDVLSAIPGCPVVNGNAPTRRAKITFLLKKKCINNVALEDFMDKDVTNILELFRIFNDGTHGSSGTSAIPKLYQIKRRAEDGILFLVNLASPAH